MGHAKIISSLLTVSVATALILALTGLPNNFAFCEKVIEEGKAPNYECTGGVEFKIEGGAIPMVKARADDSLSADEKERPYRYEYLSSEPSKIIVEAVTVFEGKLQTLPRLVVEAHLDETGTPKFRSQVFAVSGSSCEKYEINEKGAERSEAIDCAEIVSFDKQQQRWAKHLKFVAPEAIEAKLFDGV